MSDQPALRVALLLVLLGVATLAFAWTGVAPQTDATHHYVAYEVHYDEDAVGDEDEDAFVLTNQHTGDNLTWLTALGFDVDERIGCLPYDDLACSLLADHYDDPRDVPYARSSQFDYVFLETGFYRVDPPHDGGQVEFEQVDGETVFDELSLESRELRRQERRALDDGRVITTARLPNSNRLVEHEGAYYTLGLAGHEEDGFCTSSPADDFCDEAGRHRTLRWAGAFGVGLLGLLGTLVGGRRLFRAGRSVRAD